MIEGDNLEVLKLLQKSYAGKVKLVYIDPPYNTGNDFVYPDDFRDSIKNYLELTGQIEGGKKTSSNTESSGRYHTDWLNMIFPRLHLARTVLTPDGIILISIDDHEVDNLRLVCNDVFGEENFIAQIFWEKGRKNDAKLISEGHDYILIYAKNKSAIVDRGTKWREAKPGAAEIQQEYLRLRSLHHGDNERVQSSLREFYAGLPKGHLSKKLSRYGNVDDRGVWRDDNMSWPGGGGPTYDVLHPVTGKRCKVPEGGWRYSTLEKMNKMIEAGRVQFRADHTEPPIRKTYLVRSEEELDVDDESVAADEADSDDVGIQVAGTYFYRSALQASNLMLEMFGAKVFDNPKDHEVLARWFSYVTAGDKNAVVLDFFAGSGTTGHAVMSMNASDNGSRRFVLVQLPEPLDPSKKDQKVAAEYCDKLGKPRKISELTKERLRRSAKLVAKGDSASSFDAGFRVFSLDTSNIRAWDPNRDNIAATLDEAAEHLKGERTEQDILFELLLKLGLDLTVPIQSKSIAGKAVHSIGAGVLLACLTDKIGAKDIEPLALGIAEWHKALAPAGETQIVFRDSAFADDVAKTNLTAILQQHGLETVRSL